MIEKIRINRFCCCCNIRTGGLVIGVFGWVGSLLNSMALTTNTQTETITESDEGLIVQKETSSNTGLILISIFMFAISACLVYGIYQNNRRFILPWLIIKGIECVVLILATLVLFFMLFVSEEVGILFIVFFIIGGFSALFCYCWICVWSLYMDMGETTLAFIPTSQTMPMDDPNMQKMQMQQYHPNMQMQNIQMQQYPNDTFTNPPQEMV